jgi:FkbM family methyltransferase
MEKVQNRFTAVYKANRMRCDDKADITAWMAEQRDQGMRSVIDLGCGDVSWADGLGFDSFIGVDAVRKLIDLQEEIYPWFRGRHADLEVPEKWSADIVLLRDVLPYHCNGAAEQILWNAVASDWRRLVVSTNHRARNSRRRGLGGALALDFDAEAVKGTDLFEPILRLWGDFGIDLVYARGDRHFDYVEIGAADYDTILQNTVSMPKPTRGLTVEPVAYHLDRLHSNGRNTKMNVAIGKERGEVEIFYLNPELRESRDDIPWYLTGCSMVGKPHPHCLEKLAELGIPADEGVRARAVEIITFSDLADRAGIETIGHLKIDAEGMDLDIVESMLSAAAERPAILPGKITFEVHQENRAGNFRLSRAIAALEHHGYHGGPINHQDYQMVRFFARSARAARTFTGS